MSWLPPELVLLVRDALVKQATFAEYVAIGRVCRDWRARSRQGFARWLDGRAVGHPLEPFRGSDGELSFVTSQLEGE